MRWPGMGDEAAMTSADAGNVSWMSSTADRMLHVPTANPGVGERRKADGSTL